MAEYNPSKIIKDGNTYNFRDTTKIPLAGTSALAGSIVPSTDNAYDLGSTTKNLKVIYSRKIVGNGDSLDICSYALGQGAYISLDKNDTQFDGAFRIYTGTSSYKLQGNRTGTLSWSGTSIIPTSDNTCDLGSSTYSFANFYINKIYLKGNTIFNVADDNYICMGGATAQANGANLVLNGKNRSTSTGEFKLEARDGNNTGQLIGKPDGTLSWNTKNVAMQEDTIPRSGGTVIEGATFFRTSNASFLQLGGGTVWNDGATITLSGMNRTNNNGIIRIRVTDGPNAKEMYFYPSGTWTWNGTACQITSDQRYKQQITQIDDDLLTAWEDVNLVQFKYNDAVKEKSDNARLHTGYVVQQIDDACKSHGVDVSKYGLYCHEEYAEETREVEHDDGTKTIEVVRPASEHYSLRYTEALIVECAYLRKKLKELTARIEQLEKGNNTK